MPDANLQQALGTSLEEVLEKMFFAGPAEDSAEASSPVGFSAQVAFQGSAEGRLRLRVSAAAARDMASDFLAAPAESLSESRVSEVVCEMANMLCGSVLSRAGAEGTYHLGEPRPGFSAAPETPAAASCTMNVGSGTVTAELDFTETICPTEAALAS